jgi:hypothetical protein
MDNLQKDELLWQMAKKRAAFKWSLVSYLVINAFFVALWYFTSGPYSYFWPIWPMLGWGLGIAFQYFGAYHCDKVFTVEEEYEKLKKQQSNFK